MTYPRAIPDLFDGGQILMVGRYEQPGPTSVLVKGDYLGKQQTFEYSADLAKLSDRFSYAFVEQLWGRPAGGLPAGPDSAPRPIDRDCRMS